MKRLSLAEYQSLTHNAQVLSRDQHGDKVLLLPDHRIIKFFRRKRLFSSTLLFPCALRFQRASRRLKELGIKSVEVQAVYRIPAIKRHAVIYPMLTGVEFREAILKLERRDELLERLAIFLAKLHAQGVYFRAMHFGNILEMPDGTLAIIDISEARFKSRPLTLRLRARNFRPFVAYPKDINAIIGFGFDRFVKTYLDAAQIPVAKRPRFGGLLQSALN